MAGMREMALGIASALRSGVAPNPLPVELRFNRPASQREAKALAAFRKSAQNVTV